MCESNSRLRGEVEIRDSEFRVRGILDRLGLADSPPHPETSLSLRLRPLPARAGLSGEITHRRTPADRERI
jgi:hypothetical protein